MLASSFKFSTNNASDQTINVSIAYNPWKFDSNGALAYGTPPAPLTAAPTAGTSADTSAVDNTTDLNLGAHLDITLTPAVAATGTVVVYLVNNSGDQQTIALVSATFAAGDGTTPRIYNAEI